MPILLFLYYKIAIKLLGSNSGCYTPIFKGDKFSLSQCPKGDLDIQAMKGTPYTLVVGSLMYAQVCTHLDIGYIIELLGRYFSNPGMDHWKAVK